MNCQNNAVLVSEFVRKLPTAARARKRAYHTSRTLINAAGLNSRLKSASQHVSFLGQLDHKESMKRNGSFLRDRCNVSTMICILLTSSGLRCRIKNRILEFRIYESWRAMCSYEART